MFSFSFLDIFDILIVSTLFFFIIRFFTGTRAIHMLTGLLIIVFLAILAHTLDLVAMKWIVRGLGDIWVVIFVIVFQPEIRRALTNLGKSSRLDYFIQEDIEKVSLEVSEAAGLLSDKRIGALIAIERKVSMESYIRTGIKMEAVVSSDLLVSIFSVYSPLHDGAVIIQGEQIVAAKSILPLTDHPDLSPSLGTRHRAAIGLTEETDSICVVVSEETGKISLTVGGDFFGDLNVEELKTRIGSLLRR
ncbi:diadenylate cyclase CdaA [candidate division WOR-3 bacterium]|nr:diadenylate cyclase CdaA [candidate division WOR-3 bacterium]